jgi:transaldolase
MASLQDLLSLGQSVWLDFIRRDWVRDGELRARIDGGLRGLTSNPSIFDKAIQQGQLYDEQLREELARRTDAGAQALFEAVAIEDIRGAADLFRPVYDASGRVDGCVSLEVSPRLADDTAGTVAEARRLWKEVDRPNLMIKVPATPAGIPAIETLLAEGINVNVTLMFSLAHYDAVAGAYLRGAQRCERPDGLTSVASFFVSRVDTLIDKQLDTLGTPQARRLRGQVAVANSKLAYDRFRQVFGGGDFAPLAARGARPQRVLFGSTSTKDPAYSEVKYVEELIGPDTVNTLPPATIEVFVERGAARETLTEDVAGARATIGALSGLGIDLAAATEQLQRDGVKAFARSFDSLLATLEARRGELAG